MEEKRYSFTWAYVLTPIGMFVVGMAIAFASRPPTSAQDYSLFLGTALFLLFSFLVLRFGTRCVLEKTEFYRVSYFVFKNRIPIDAIEKVLFRPTYGFGKDVMSLWIVGNNNGWPRSIQMSELAYTRRVLADVVKTLLDANPHIKIEKDVEELLKKA
jgi:hypothetical protein